MTKAAAKFLIEKSKRGELGKLDNFFQIVEELQAMPMVDKKQENLMAYHVMYLRKMICRKIAKDFDEWFLKSGIPSNEWEAHLVNYAERYLTY